MNLRDIKYSSIEEKDKKFISSLRKYFEKTYPKLKRDYSIQYYEYPKNSMDIDPYIEVKNDKKGYCDIEKGIIFLSSWCCKQKNKLVTIEILLHEILHLTYIDKSEAEIVDLTSQYMKEIENDKLIPFKINNAK